MKIAIFSSVFAFVLSFSSLSHAEGLSLAVRSADGSEMALSLSDLDALPQSEFETTTIWTDDTVTFSGVSLSKLLEGINLDGATVRMVALNDYSVEMPASEIGEDYPIVATRMDGALMAIRDKGPYWVVYPYDTDAKFQTETVYARSIWQLKELYVMK